MISKMPVAGAEGDVDRKVQERFFPDTTRPGVFVEVGAARPDYLSISAHFRSLGWNVISIEPNPDFCELHRKAGHDVLQYACGDHDEDDVEFTIVDSHGAEHAGGNVSYESFSSLGIKPEYAQLKHDLDTRKIKVRLRRLDRILAEHAPRVGRIDVLSVDVEGWEIEVIDGLDMSRHRPRVMIIENLFNGSRYRDHMRGLGYLLWQRLAPNDVYVSPELLPGAGDRVALALRNFLIPFRR